MKYISLNWTLALKIFNWKEKENARLPNTYGARLYCKLKRQSNTLYTIQYKLYITKPERLLNSIILYNINYTFTSQRILHSILYNINYTLASHGEHCITEVDNDLPEVCERKRNNGT